MSRILFLDFDGVLHAAGGPPGETSLFEWVPQLADMLRPHPDVAIVVHSSWREQHSLAQMRELLGPLGERVLAAVGVGPRAGAILDYVRAHPEIGRWLVIDDAAFEFAPEFAGELVICDPLTGICDSVAQAKVRQWLRESSNG